MSEDYLHVDEDIKFHEQSGQYLPLEVPDF